MKLILPSQNLERILAKEASVAKGIIAKDSNGFIIGYVVRQKEMKWALVQNDGQIGTAGWLGNLDEIIGAYEHLDFYQIL